MTRNLISIRFNLDASFSCSSTECESSTELSLDRPHSTHSRGSSSTFGSSYGASKPLRSILKNCGSSCRRQKLSRKCRASADSSNNTNYRRVVSFSDMSRWDTQASSPPSSSCLPMRPASSSRQIASCRWFDRVSRNALPPTPLHHMHKDGLSSSFSQLNVGQVDLCSPPRKPRRLSVETPPKARSCGAPRLPRRVHSSESLFRTPTSPCSPECDAHDTVDAYLQRFEDQRERYLRKHKEETALKVAQHERNRVEVPATAEVSVVREMDQVKNSLREMQAFLATLQRVPETQKLLRQHMARAVSQATVLLEEVDEDDWAAPFQRSSPALLGGPFNIYSYNGEDDSDSDSDSEFEGALSF